MLATRIACFANDVAPHVGAWIEILRKHGISG